MFLLQEEEIKEIKITGSRLLIKAIISLITIIKLAQLKKFMNIKIEDIPIFASYYCTIL